MAKGFNLTAEINLRGPANIKQVVGNIKKQLGTINANVNININSSTVAAIGQVNSQLGALNQTLAATTTATTTAAQAFTNLAAAMGAVAGITLPPTITANVNQTTTAVTNASRAVAQTRTEFEEFGRQSALAVRRFAAFSSVTSIIYGLNNAISAGISDFITFDKQITRLSQVTNESKDGLSSLSRNITDLSTGLGVASKDLAEVSVTLAQAGLSARDTRMALDALAKSVLAPSFDSLNETVEGSIALMRQFGIGAGQLESALGSVNAVAAAFAVEASDIITAIQRTGGVFASASKGVSEGTNALNEFIAVFTSVRATTRESAETIATGLRTIFTRIQRADTVEALKEFGVVLTDLEGKFVGPYEAVRRLSEGLSGLDPRDLKFSQIVEELGGFRQIGKVLPLIQQFSTAQSALKIAQEGQGSLALDAAKGQQALAVQILKVREEFSALIRSFGDSQSFQALVKIGLDLASALIKVADATKGVLPLVGLIAAFRGVSAITQFAGGFGAGIGGNRRQRANRGGVIGFAGGGVVHKFATGGVVPGSGDSDSVPAMLTPGEFVMRKTAVKSIGKDRLHRMNKYAKGGKISDLIRTRPTLSQVYDTKNNFTTDEFDSDSPSFIGSDEYSNITIKKEKLLVNTDIYRSRADRILEDAINKYRDTNSEQQANSIISKKTQNLFKGLSSATYKDIINGKDRRNIINPIQGALAELSTKRTYERSRQDLRKLPDLYGADFSVGGSDKEFIEVKAKQEKTGDEELIAKALLAHAFMNAENKSQARTSAEGYAFKNNTAENISGIDILLRSSNIQDKHIGGMIQKFETGGKVKFNGVMYPWSEVERTATELGMSPEELEKIYNKRVDEDKMLGGRHSSEAIEAFRRAPMKLVVDSAAGRLKDAILSKTMERQDKGKSAEYERRYTLDDYAFNLGGLIQKFAGGAEVEKTRVRDRVSSLAQTKQQSISETILEQLKGLGGPAGVRQILGIPPGDSVTRSVLNASNVKANKNLDQAKDYVNRALFTSGKSDAAEAKRVSKLTQVAMAGLVPIDYNDTFEWELPESKKTIFATIKGFNKRYLAAAQQMSRETADAARNLAENMQYTDIFTGEKLAFDFDETLVAETDILGEDGKPDIPKYYDRKIVAAALAKGRLTRLGIKLKTLIEKDPEFIKQTRILTARPAETVDLLANTLQRLGLPYSASDITGVGGANIDVSKAKAVNLAKNEKLIDDSLNNINAVTKSKKSGFLYTEPKAKPELDELMGQGNIEGAVIEKALAILGANLPPIESLEANRAIDFPTGLGRAAQFFNLDPNIPTEVKRTLDGRSFEKARKEFDRFYVENPERFASGGSVPALLTPGEAVIGPKLAKKIGYAKLNRMNKADQNGMGRYASGGSVGIVPGSGNTDTFGPVPLPVGSFVIRKKATEALGFNRGGRVQKFFFGGGSRGPAPRPDTISADTIGVSNQATEGLRRVSDALATLGVTSSRSAQLLSRGYQATAGEAARATQADLIMARAVGASADVMFDLEEAAREAARATDAEIAIRQRLANISGESIQDALSNIEDAVRNAREAERQNLETTTITDASAPGGTRFRTQEEVTRDLRTGEAARREDAINRVAAGGGVGGSALDLSALGATGEDLARVFQMLSRDGATLQQMNNRLIQVRRDEAAAIAMAAGETARAARIRAGLEQDINDAINAEIRAREEAINESARSAGATGPNERQRVDNQQRMMMDFAVMTVGNIIADNISAKSSSMAAGAAGAVRGGTQAYAVTNQISSQLTQFSQDLAATRPRLAAFAGRLGNLVKGAQAVLVLGQAATEAYNSIRTFYLELEKNNIETSLAGLSEQFEKLNKDLNQLNLKNDIQASIIDATRAAERLRQQSLDTSVAGLVNGFDILTSYLSQDPTANRQSSLRGQVLEKEGIVEYLKLALGDANRFEGKAAQYAKTQGTESAQTFKPIAENVNQLVSARIKSGENINDILGGPEFKEFATSLVYADAALNRQIRSIELSTRLTEEEKQERIQEIIALQGANKLRATGAVAQREVDQKDLSTTLSVYTRSLKRMFTNMEQSINAAAYSLKQMTDNIDLATAAIQGQAKAGNIDLETANVIQNPRAYDSGRVASAQASAGSLFGSRGPEMSKLINLGETVESTVMSTINKTLESKGPDASNEAIARSVDAAVREQLQGLGLPPELSDKLAKEVGTTLTDLRSNRDDKIDFAKLSEKLGGLNSVIDVAKDAQQSAIKALENYQNALNTYTSNINRVVDLETSARDRQNKAIQISADGSLALSKSLGILTTASDAAAKRNATVSRQTGGLTDPTDIFNKIEDLNRQRGTQQGSVKQAAERGPSAAADFVKFNTELKNTNIALRENRAALEEMANNTNKASAAMDAIGEAQQKAAGRVGFLEKVVTSTPDELQSLNQSLYRLERNINGQQNSIQNSVGAQKAYTDAINNGASAAEAMKAAQTAYAGERKETMGALQDILPFLGDSQQAGNIKANVLETMLKESGMGVSPIFQQILNTLRNPEQDPATAAAIQYYNQAIGEQSEATRLLGQLDQNLASDIAQNNTKMLLDGLTKTALTFENSELKDISGNVNSILSIMKAPVAAPGAPVPAAGISTGGLIYAAAGQLVNFQPKGTDTVPAMLTPGEFVVNRRATQANLPLLQNINSSYSRGGQVSYYAAGGYVSNYGDPAVMENAGMKSKFAIIDPSVNNEGIWSNAIGKITNLPNVYTLQFSTASSRALPTKDNYRLDSGNVIKPNDGEVRLGAMPGIRWDGKTGYYYDANQDLINSITAGGTIVKGKNNNVYLGQREFTQIKPSKEDEAKIQEKFKSFAEFNKPQGKVEFDPSDYVDKMPSVGDFAGKLTADSWNPNIITGSYGLRFENSAAINTDNPSIVDAQAYKIWKYQRSWFNPAQFGGKATAVSVGPPTFDVGSPYIDRNAKDFAVDTQGADQGIVFPKLATDMAEGIITGNRISDSNQINDTNYQLYRNTLDFLDGKGAYSDTGLGKGLQQKLQDLFQGKEPFIQLADSQISPFDKLKELGAKSAIIAQKSLESSFRVAAESASSSADIDSKNIKFGMTAAPPATVKPELIIDPFELTEAATRITSSFPIMINGNMDLLGKDFKNVATKELLKNKSKISSRLITDNLKLTLPFDINGNKPSFDIPIAYEEYAGQLFDMATKDFDGVDFQTYLPNNISGTLFAGLDKTNRRLFTTRQYTEADILKAAGAGGINFNDIKDLAVAQMNQDPNAGLLAEKVRQDSKLVFADPQNSLIKYTGIMGQGGVDVFSGISDEPNSVNIGDILLEKLKESRSKFGEASRKVDQAPGMAKKGATFSDAEAKKATALLIRGSLPIFARLPMPGFPSSWLYNSGAGQALRYANMGGHIEAAMHMVGVFNQAGQYVSQLKERSTSIQSYDILDNVYTMVSGAAAAFSDIAGGNTSLLKQFYQAQTPIEALFRSYGTSARFGKVSGLKLNGDWKNILGNQLDGTKIRTVGRDGTLSDKSLVEAIPENASVNDLIKVLFNPYNEFENTSTRSSLIQKFGNDLFNLRNEDGMQYFDRNTLQFIRTGLLRLIDWYGGSGNWVGQDYFFDKQIEPDNAKRTTTFMQSYQASGSKLYGLAQEAQTLFGLTNAFGPLPTAPWFMSRSMVEPQKRAAGGIIYAADGGGPFVNFAPQGTDTVPAMLTPGEFVVNRQATQKNLPLLRAMNAGGNVKPYSRGGVVYLQKAGVVPEAPEFDLGTTTEYRPENTFGNRSISTLSKIQYESRYGIPGIRNNVKTISDDQYLFLKSKTEEESRLRKEGTPLLYSDKNTRAKLAKANALKLNKKEYTQLSIGETERFVPFKNRLTREYFPNGADFDSGVFDNTMLDFKDQPVINYLNVDVRTPKQRLEVIKDAIKNKQGFPDLLSKYLLGMQEYEDTWASMGLSMIIDLPNMAAPLTPGDMGIPIASKALSWLSKTKIASVLQNTAKRGRTTLGKLRKLSFGGAEKASEAVPVDELLDPKLVNTITEESDQAATKAATGKPVAKTVDTATELAEKIQLLRKQWDEVVVSTRQRISDMTASGDSKYLIPQNKNAFAAIDEARAKLELVQRKIGMIEKAGKDNFDEASRIADEGLDIGRLNKLAENFFQLRGGWDQVPVNKLPKDQLAPQANSLAQKKASGVWSQADQARSDDLAARIQSGGAVFNPPPKPSTLTQAADDAASAGLPKAADDAASAGLPKAADDAAAAAAKQKSIFGKIWEKLPKKGTIALVAGAAALAKWASKPETQPGPGPRPEDVKPPVEMPDDVAVDPNNSGGKGAVGPVVPPIERAAADAAAANAAKVSTTSKPDYYDSQSYKEFINSEIQSGKAPTAPDKLKFTTAVVYTRKSTGKDKYGYSTYDRYRTTAYDQRKAEGSSWVPTGARGGESVDSLSQEEITNRIYGDEFSPTQNFGDNAFGTSPITGDRKTVQKERKKRKEANTALLNSAGVSNYESSGSTYIYTGKDPTTYTSIDPFTMWLDNETIDFYSLTPEEQNNSRKKYLETVQNKEEGTSEVTSRSNPRQEYETAYAHWRKILGEYNYHQSIGKGDKYAAGKKTITTLAGRKMATGGIVYASAGMLIPYQPQGTDTVPAMLTPGEFVINRAATQKHLPLLTAINNGSAPSALSKGGMAYLENGGEVSASFGRLGTWTPDKNDLGKLKERKTEIEQKKVAVQDCRTKLSEEEKAKESRRLETLNKGPSDEELQAKQENEDRRKQAIDARNQAGIKLRELKDSFRKQFYADLQAVKDETGIGSNEEIFKVVPRLHAEFRFTSKNNKNWEGINTADDNVAEFLNQITGLKQSIMNDNWFTLEDTDADLTNIEEVMLKPVNAFLAAAGWKEEERKNPALSPNAAMPTKDYRAAIAECADAVPKARGGMIYASEGTLVNYQPMGTDTVPAMLTPGEFVINKAATQRHLPLLNAINSGAYSDGGVIYLSGGTGAPLAKKAGYKDTSKGGTSYYDQQQQQRAADYNNEMQRRRDEYGGEQQRRRDAYKAHKEQKIPYAQAYAQQQQANPNAREQAMMQQQQQAQTGGPGGAPQIAPQVQQAVGMASQAAFDPSSYGDVNKQMVIFGTLLTGVNQTLVQFGAVIQQLTGVINGGGAGQPGQPQGGNQGQQGGIGDITAKLGTLVEQLNGLNIPENININVTHQPLQVNVTGAEAMKALLEGPFQEAVKNAIKQVTTDKNVKNEQSPDE